MDNNNYTYYEKRIVAFVDILGFKEHVKHTMVDKDKEEDIYKALKSLSEFKEDNENVKTYGMKSLGREITVFSDSIVISYNLNIKSALFYILIDLIHLQMDLLRYNIILRGGIAYGLIYHNGNIVYGPAMIEAYELESKEAVYPRIIISTNTIAEVCKVPGSCSHEIGEELNYILKLLKKDDNYYFLNYISQFEELDYPEDEYYYWLKNIRKIIIDGLKENKDTKVIKKYRWFLNYFNNFISDKNSFFPISLDEKETLKKYKKLKIKRSDYIIKTKNQMISAV